MINGKFSKQFSDSILVTEQGKSLPAEKAAFVKLSNQNRLDDENKTLIAGGLNYDNGKEIFWGFGGKYPHQLFTTQETDWIPVNNLADISIKCLPGNEITLQYSFLVE